MDPFGVNDPWPLATAGLTVAVLVAVAVVLAGRRDVGSGALQSHDVAAPRSFGLDTAASLAARLEAPTVVGWWIGLTGMGVMLGIVSEIIAEAVP